jgi:hypothetical protein
MKNIFLKSISVLLIIASMMGCQDKLEELYQDPDGFSKQQADKSGLSVIAGFFTSQLTRGFFLRGEYGAAYHQMRSGSRVMGTGIQLYYNTVDYGMSYTLRDVEHDWGTGGFNNTVFDKINGDWIKQVLWAQREYNKIAEADRSKMDELYMNLLHVLKAYGYQRATDLYDKVPYIETGSAGALDGEKAQYLGQAEIYPKIIDELKEVETYLSTLELLDGEQAAFTNQDVIFDGNIMMWRKYINSLRLRCAMNISEVMPDITSDVLTELNGKPLFDMYSDVAGLADIAIVEPYRLQRELGITRAFRERGDEARAPSRFLDDLMHCMPVEKSAVVNGETLFYFEGDKSMEGWAKNEVDPRVAYIFSKNINGHYFGAEHLWDDGTDPNSYYSKIMRGYYINDPILTDINITEFSFGSEAEGNLQTIVLNAEAAADLTKREAFLNKALRERCSKYQDNGWNIGTNRNMISEYNVVPQYNFDLRYPTLHAVETELMLAEAAVRGLGTVTGTAREHYKKAIELSCDYWLSLHDHNYTKSSTPSFPSNSDDARIAEDKQGAPVCDHSAYAEFEATRFDDLSDLDKVDAIFKQMQLHYNFFNWEIVYTTARRMIKHLGDNPAAPYEVFMWKERMSYPGGIQASDPDNWAIISAHNDVNLPVWLTGRTEKWKNIME